MHTKNVIARKVKKARIKQIKEMTKNHLFIFVELLQLIHDIEIEWKKINEIWLVEQEKKDRKKKSRLEKSVKKDDDDDDDTEFIINKFDDEEDFISSKMRMRETKMRRMRDMRSMIICVRIIQLMTNSTRGIFLMTWTMNVLLRHYIAS
jgi:hypothetical protein